MTDASKPLSETFTDFFNSERAGGVVLIACTVLALAIANSPAGSGYREFWQIHIAGLSLEHWVNEGLMAVFFLLIGLELERELYVGELADFRNAMLPIAAAIGGMVVPAGIHYFLNAGTPTQSGFGIPMATDIAFTLGVLAVLGSRIPPALKVFVVAFAVIDDLGAIVVIAVVYTKAVSIAYLGAAVAIWTAMILLNRLRILALTPYLVGGVILWILLLKSGIHATLAGVLLAFAIPFKSKGTLPSPSHRVEHFLHKPVAFIIVPIFALANTAVVIGSELFQGLISANGLGIVLGLAIGKPLGVLAGCAVLVGFGLSRLPNQVSWRHLIGAGILGGIGFTMSIFITNLAFSVQPEFVDGSKFAILLGSLVAGLSGYLFLRFARD